MLILTKINKRMNTYTEIQKMYLIKLIIGALTGVFLSASIGREIYENFDANIILIKDYLMGAPMLIILIPFVSKWINDNPITCHKLKGSISIIGLVMLLIVEMIGLSKMWYLVDAAFLSLTSLLMQPHNAYYTSSIVNKSKEFSKAIGHVDLFGSVLLVVLGITIVMLDVPTIVLLIISLPLEIYERVLENKCVKEIYKDTTPN